MNAVTVSNVILGVGFVGLIGVVLVLFLTDPRT